MKPLKIIAGCGHEVELAVTGSTPVIDVLRMAKATESEFCDSCRDQLFGGWSCPSAHGDSVRGDADPLFRRQVAAAVRRRMEGVDE